MTIFCGMFRYAASDRIDREVHAALIKAISRAAEDPRETYSDERCHLVKVDIGAYGERAFHKSSDGTIGMLVGEPLLDRGDFAERRDRGQDLEELHNQWLTGDRIALEQAHGTFAAVHYDSKRRRLAITTDKLGVRPVYWWNGPGIIVFANALRILEALDFVPKVMDLRGAAEKMSIGFSLGRRTQYQGIFCLDAGELVEVTEGGPRSETYWRWDHLDGTALAPELARRELRRAFSGAVARRLHPDETSTICFLSGGLDSRCIATELVEQGKNVQSFNMSWSGTYDQVLGKIYAEKLGTSHYQSNIEPGALTYPWLHLEQAVLGATGDSVFRPERPRIIFSGDGGSVGLGHVYMNREMVDNLRAGCLDQAVLSFIRYNKVVLPLRFMSSQAKGLFEQIIPDGVSEAFSRFECRDPGRNIYVFLLVNDQRRHLATYFENIDTIKFEMHLPFFDFEVLQIVNKIQLNELLCHKFYYDWLDEFPEVVTSVPWQSYPGHIPCPLPMPEEYRSQWYYDRSVVGLTKRNGYIQDVRDAAKDPNFPRQFWCRWRLWLAIMATAIGVRDFTYVFRAVLASHAIARQCDVPPAL